MSELEPHIRHSLERLVRRATDSHLDWEDVKARARNGRRRTSVLAGTALACLVIGVAAGFGVGPGLWHLFAGTPVSPDRLSPEEQRFFASMSSGKPVLRSEPNALELKQLKGKVSIRLLATRGGRSFYVIDVRGPTPRRCLAIGRARTSELLGSMGCFPPGQFPSPEQPIADYSEFGASARDPVVRIERLEGFAADAVVKVGLLDAHGKLTAPVLVVDNTYLRTTGLPIGEVQAIVAYDRSGRRVSCLDVARAPIVTDPGKTVDACGERTKPAPPMRAAAPPPRPQPPKLGRHLQEGSSGGVSVDIYEPGIAVFELGGVDSATRRLLTGPSGLVLGCLRVRFYRGQWLADEYTGSARFAKQLVRDFVGQAPDATSQLPPPYDGCELGGLYGHRWNDAFGTRDVVEIPLTDEGRHFFNDRATARDLAYFVRSGRVQRIRLSANPKDGLEAFVRRYPSRVIELSSSTARAPEHAIGFWIGERTIVFKATSSTGREFLVVARRRTLKLPEKNLGDLAFVF
jgi:hypothetical protein